MAELFSPKVWPKNPIRHSSSCCCYPLTLQSHIRCLGHVQRLKQEEMAQIVDLCVRPQNNVDYRPGQHIIRQGDVGEDFFILKAGSAHASVATPQVPPPLLPPLSLLTLLRAGVPWRCQHYRRHR